jgi:hypothetical protein
MPEVNVKQVPAIPPWACPTPSRTNPFANRRQLTLMIASAMACAVLIGWLLAGSLGVPHQIRGAISLFTPNPSGLLDVLP